MRNKDVADIKIKRQKKRLSSKTEKAAKNNHDSSEIQMIGVSLFGKDGLSKLMKRDKINKETPKRKKRKTKKEIEFKPNIEALNLNANETAGVFRRKRVPEILKCVKERLSL